MDNDRIRQRLWQTPSWAPHATRDLDAVVRRCERRVRRRRAITIVSSAALALAVALPLSMLWGLQHRAAGPGAGGSNPSIASNTPSPSPTPSAVLSAVSGDGITVQIPDGWQGRVYEGDNGAVLQLATVALTEEDKDMAGSARRLIGVDGAVVVLLESSSQAGRTSPPRSPNRTSVRTASRAAARPTP
jgi:hypothetical protein